jgi:hypothetical protein
MDLLAAYPGRPFRMAGIVNYICGKAADRRQKKRVTEGVRRVLQALEDAGSIVVERTGRSGESATYTWRVHAETQGATIC